MFVLELLMLPAPLLIVSRAAAAPSTRQVEVNHSSPASSTAPFNRDSARENPGWVAGIRRRGELLIVSGGKTKQREENPKP